MHHIDVPMDYRVRYYAETLPKTHVKAGQRNAVMKDRFEYLYSRAHADSIK